MDLQELEATAQLARLNTGKDELAAALPAFEQMLGFFAAMQEADTTVGNGKEAAGAEPQNRARAGSRLVGADHFREDNAVMPDAIPGEVLVDNAGERDGPFIVIPNVL